MIGLGQVIAGGAIVLGQSTGPQQRVSNGTTDTTAFILDQCKIPAYLPTEHSRFFIESTWSYPNSAAQKILNPRLGNNSIGQASPTTSVSSTLQNKMWNAGTLLAQRFVNATSWGIIGSSNAVGSLSYDMTQDQFINFACSWNIQITPTPETIILEEWTVFMTLPRR